MNDASGWFFEKRFGISSTGGSTLFAIATEELGWEVDVLPTRRTHRECLRVTGLPVNEISGGPLVARLEFDEPE